MIFAGITFNPSDICTLKRFGNGVFMNLVNLSSTDTNTVKEVYASTAEAEARLVSLSSALSSYGLVNTIEGIRIGAQAVVKIESANKKTTTITFIDNTSVTLTYNEQDITNIASKMGTSGGGGGGGSDLTKDITATGTVGGIQKGTTFLAGTPLEDVLEQLITIYEAPGITIALSVPAVNELGSSIASTTITAKVTKGSAALTTLQFLLGSSVIDSRSISAGGNYNYTYATSINSDSTFKVKIADDTGASETAQSEVKFVRPFYYGNSDTFVVSDPTTLTKSVTAKGNKTVSYTANNKYIVFAYDKNYGNLSKILDENDFPNTDAWTKSVSGDYAIYVSNTPMTITNYSYKFEF